jgi:hypothetical protein
MTKDESMFAFPNRRKPQITQIAQIEFNNLCNLRYLCHL